MSKSPTLHGGIEETFERAFINNGIMIIWIGVTTRLIATAMLVMAVLKARPSSAVQKAKVAKVDRAGIGKMPPHIPTAIARPIWVDDNDLLGLMSFSFNQFFKLDIANQIHDSENNKPHQLTAMENIRRFAQYLRSPLVACGTAHAAVPMNPFHGLDDVPDSFYRLFGRPWGQLSALKRIWDSTDFMIESAAEAFDIRHPDTAMENADVIDDTKRRVFHLLGLPAVSGYEDRFSESAQSLLEHGKRIVPLVLGSECKSVVQDLHADHGYTLTGSAEGDGFTCQVFRTHPHHSRVPIYVITGELEISADEFHALVCDVAFRHNWDDQFHHAAAVEIEESCSLVEWIVKWPWPLAPREYRYILSPARLDDGTNLVMATSVPVVDQVNPSAVPVKEYFGITAAKPVGPSRCRYCVFYYDDPSLPGRMPSWLEQYVAKQLLPSFPKKVLNGARIYPRDRLLHYSQLSTN
jgi:hypothetical protein